MSTDLNPNKHPGRHLRRSCQSSFRRTIVIKHAVSHTRVNANRDFAAVPRRCAEHNRGVASSCSARRFSCASKASSPACVLDAAMVCETANSGTFQMRFRQFEDLCAKSVWSKMSMIHQTWELRHSISKQPQSKHLLSCISFSIAGSNKNSMLSDSIYVEYMEQSLLQHAQPLHSQ